MGQVAAWKCFPTQIRAGEGKILNFQSLQTCFVLEVRCSKSRQRPLASVYVTGTKAVIQSGPLEIIWDRFGSFHVFLPTIPPNSLLCFRVLSQISKPSPLQLRWIQMQSRSYFKQQILLASLRAWGLGNSHGSRGLDPDKHPLAVLDLCSRGNER